MSFYGSIYYQLVDAFNRLWFSNQGKDTIIFPEAEDLVNQNPPEGVPEETFEYHSPGRQGVIDLKSGNRWIAFTQNSTDNSFKLWHREPDEENVIPGHGFYHIPNTYFIIQEAGEKTLECIDRCIQETSERIAEEGGNFSLEENCRVVIELHREDPNMDPSHEIYKYNAEGEWEKELGATQDMVTILSPDDFFATTENFTVDAAGHMVPGARHLYKMPKSDVQEEIDALKTRMTKNEEHDEEQDEDIEVLEEYVGSWDKYRGEVAYTGFNYWVPSIADAIGDMCELIMGPDGATKFDDEGNVKQFQPFYKNNKDVTIARVIGNLTALRENLKTYDNAFFNIDEDTKLSDISLIDVILYIKDQLVAANTQGVSANAALITNLTYDINTLQNDTIPAIQRKDTEQDGRLELVEGRATALEEEDVKIYNKIAQEVGVLNLEDARIDKKVDDHNLASTQAHNQLREDLTKQGETLTEKINNDIGSLDEKLTKKIDDDISGLDEKFTNEIEAIHNVDTGILKQAQDYSDALRDGAVAGNTAKIEAINHETTGILAVAKGYTDGEIQKLNYTDDNASDGKYVYSVSEANGVISVEHKDLPTYTLAQGSAPGTIALNGNDASVNGLGTAAFANIDNFDVAGSAATAKTEAIAEAGNLIQALTTEGGAIQVNAKAIEDLQKLLEGYADLVAKVTELEQRIIALEPPPPEKPENGTEPEPEPDPEPTPEEGPDEPEPDPEEGTDDPETT